MSLAQIVNDRFNEWETLVRDFIKQADQCQQYGLVEAAKVQLSYGYHLKEQLSDPDMEDRDRLMFVEDLKSRTRQRIEAAIHHPIVSRVGG